MFHIILNLNLQIHHNQEGFILSSKGCGTKLMHCAGYDHVRDAVTQEIQVLLVPLWFVMQKLLENLVGFFSFCSEMYNFIATLLQNSLGFIFFIFHF